MSGTFLSPCPIQRQWTKHTLAPLILVVDDDPPIQEAISRTLTRAGYRVLMASDGTAALEMVADSPPDLIILDIYLPVLDGRRFAQMYRQKPGPHAPILVVTGAGHAAERAAALGAAGYLDKPFGPKELRKKVAELAGPPPV